VKPYPIKLVRDRVAEVDTSEGLTYRPVVDHDEHVRRLRAKLVEEVGEYLIDPSVGELADVIEAAESLATVDLGVSIVDVWNAIREKHDDRGGFTEGTVMETIEPE
jgi:predicted house-cleaning noncanonical NTP pyrophosphatase (MazG superfamily)